MSEKAHESYIRQRLRINGIRTISSRFIRRIVDVNDEKLSSLLGIQRILLIMIGKIKKRVRRNYDRATFLLDM